MEQEKPSTNYALELDKLIDAWRASGTHIVTIRRNLEARAERLAYEHSMRQVAV